MPSCSSKGAKLLVWTLRRGGELGCLAQVGGGGHADGLHGRGPRLARRTRRAQRRLAPSCFVIRGLRTIGVLFPRKAPQFPVRMPAPARLPGQADRVTVREHTGLALPRMSLGLTGTATPCRLRAARQRSTRAPTEPLSWLRQDPPGPTAIFTMPCRTGKQKALRCVVGITSTPPFSFHHY